MYDEALAQRVRLAMAAGPAFSERKMFGGLSFLVGGNMACGIVGEELMVRTGPAAYDDALAQPQVRPMEFTGRPMKGMVFVAPAGLDDASLERWVNLGTNFAQSLPAKDAAAKKR